ncbi:MAG: phosphoenolpyruvate carboxykinase domain-containing protein [Verrucomicrobia bacterium]|nr:phosphoenolpyruvate carboxykinase domain-containing protein [Verrucomicrobiota bacterium]
MADYFGHWFDMGERIRQHPKIFHVNWFRTDEKGKFLWPGFGENLRILEWILARCRGEAAGVQSPIGYLPNPKDIDMSGLKMPAGAMDKLLAVNKKEWLAELDSVKKFFDQFGSRLPDQLWAQHEALRQRLLASKA